MRAEVVESRDMPRTREFVESKVGFWVRKKTRPRAESTGESGKA